MLEAVTSGVSTVIGWVGTVVEALTDSTDGALYPLLGLLAVGIAVSAVSLGISLIRRITWGA